MKNKNKPKNVVDGFSCILDFPKISGGEDPRTPLLKGIHQLNPQNLSSTIIAAKAKKEPESPPPLKQSTIKSIFRLYRNWKKEERSFLCDL